MVKEKIVLFSNDDHISLFCSVHTTLSILIHRLWMSHKKQSHLILGWEANYFSCLLQEYQVRISNVLYLF